jgi:hypothetical protein
VLGIDDPQIWLAYLACVLSALGCMVYGILYWTGKEEEKAAKRNARKSVKQ